MLIIADILKELEARNMIIPEGYIEMLRKRERLLLECGKYIESNQLEVAKRLKAIQDMCKSPRAVMWQPFSKFVIAKELGVSHHTVHRWIAIYEHFALKDPTIGVKDFYTPEDYKKACRNVRDKEFRKKYNTRSTYAIRAMILDAERKKKRRKSKIA